MRILLNQCLFDCREFITEYISVCFLTMLNFFAFNSIYYIFGKYNFRVSILAIS